MRFAAGLLLGMLLVAPETVPTEVVTVETVPAVDEWVETPLIDALVDWVEVDRQTDCLWEYLQQHDIELTLENVITTGDWTDMHGGACAMMEGEDDE